MLAMMRLASLNGLGARRVFAFIAAVSLLATALETVAMVIPVRIFERLVRGDGGSIELGIVSVRLGLALALGFGAVVASVALQVIVGNATARLSASYLAAQRTALLEAFAVSDMQAQERYAEGELQELVSSVCYQASLLPMRMATMVGSAVACATLVIAAFLVNAAAAAVLVGSGLALALMLKPLTRLAASAIDRHTSLQRQLAQRTGEWSMRFREYRSFGVEQAALDPVAEAVRETSDELRRVRGLTHLGVTAYRGLTEAVLIALVGLAVWASTQRPLESALVLVVALRALSYSQQFNSARQVALEAAGPARVAQVAISELRSSQRIPGPVRLASFERLEVNGADLLQTDGKRVLSNVNLRVNRGDRVALVGPSGGGKSTLLAALAGLQTVSTGTIVVNETLIESIDPECWSSICALAAQTPALVSGDIRSNVRFYRQVDDGVIMAALDDLGMLEDGGRILLQQIGARDSGLSGGQLQRVALARALVGFPALLLLDEPTSALDADTEERVIARLRSLSAATTVVLATHRPGPLQLCTRFFGVRNATITELASVDEAIAFCTELPNPIAKVEGP